MVLNIVCAVLIIPFNKWLFQHLHFRFGLTCKDFLSIDVLFCRWVLLLSLSHFVFTWLSSGALIHLGFVEKKAFPHMKEFLPVIVLNVGSLITLNMSLASNSIGVYQLSKMMTVPGNPWLLVPFSLILSHSLVSSGTVLTSYLMYGKTYSWEVLGSLGLMTVGIGLAIGTRVEVRLSKRVVL